MLIKLTELAKKPEFRNKGIGRKFGAQSTRIPENDLAKKYIYPPDRPKLIAVGIRPAKPLPTLATNMFANVIKEKLEEKKKEFAIERKRKLAEEMKKKASERSMALKNKLNGNKSEPERAWNRPFTLE